jgi:hypothetical protein
MRTICLFIFSLSLLTAISATTFAGDYAHFHFIGFSRAGQYLAFEEYGINDDVDDSSAYSVIYIVDVLKNEWAMPPFKANGNPSPYDENMQYDADKIETDVRDRNMRRAAGALRRYKIVEGNTGLQVVAHLINEYDVGLRTVELPAASAVPMPAPEMFDNSNSNVAGRFNSNSALNSNSYIPNANANSASSSNTAPYNSNAVSNSMTDTETPDANRDPMENYLAFLPQTVAFTKRGNALYQDGFYELKINPVPVKQKNCDEYERDMFSFELTLKNERDEVRVLQRSGPVPRNRGCVDGYGIQEAYVYHNRLAVFIGIFTRGWEGENMRLMSVTGELDK